MISLNRILGYALAAFMAFMGIQKFMGGVPIFAIIETNIGAQWGLDLPWIEPWGRFLTGGLEIIAAALLVLGRRLEGGALSVAIIVGAIGAHLTVLGISTPMSSDPSAEASPMLFMMAIAGGMLSAAVFLGAARKTGTDAQ